MKSNFAVINRTQAKRLTDEAAKKDAYQLRDEIHDAIEKDIMEQTIATMLWTLHKHFGFGRLRLLRLKNLLEDEYKLMNDGVVSGRG